MADTKDQVSLNPELRDQLYAVRSQLRNFSLVRGLTQFCLAALVAMIAVGAIDFFFPLPWTVRIGVLVALAIFAFAVLARWVKNRDQIDDLSAAKEIERANPALGQRIRTSQQFDTEFDVPNKTTETPKLTSALIDQTNKLTSNLDLASPIPWKSLRKWFVGVAAVACGVLCIVGMIPEARTTLVRMFMVPAHYSSLDVAELKPVVAGSDATFTAVATGRPLKNVELWVRDAEAKDWRKVPMLPPAADKENLPKQLKGELTAKIEKCEHDLVYKIVASPLPNQDGNLKVLQPLEQKSFQASVEPPTYTGVEKKTISEMEFSVVEGSMVAVELELNREPATAELVSTDSGKSVPLEIDGTKLVCDLSQLEKSQSYEFSAESEDGMKFNSDRVRIRVKKDKRPTVAFQKPKDELSVFATTEVGLNLRVSDDFGVGKVGIEYQINDGERKTLWEQDAQGKTQLTALPVMYLEDHDLTHEDAITYYAFAEDNRPDAKRTRSELQFIDIQPYKREYQVVDSNCKGGSCNCLTLEELIKRQRHNLRRTFANLDRQPVQDSLSKRLATSQEEIKKATEEFTAGWEQEFGPMPMLHDAAKTMAKATTKLENKALDPAMPLEESALADLIRAKQNARKFLKNCKSSSSGQFSQCKNFDTSMAQRIRQPKKKEDAEQQSMAQARKQIQKMAQQQKRFSEDVAAASGGAKLDKRPNQQQQSRSQSQSASKSQSQSKQGMAKSQQSAAQRAQQMQQAMQRNEAASELAQQRMDEASQKIEESAQEMQQGNQMAAAEKAKQAAELLEQLDEHLKGLSGSDLAQRMSIAEQIAARLANAESNVAQSLDEESEQGSEKREELADTQKRLGNQAETLADLIRHLEADSLGENSELRQGLDELQNETEPDVLADDMKNIARQIAEQDRRAANGASSATKQLQQMASELGALRRNAMQPQLDELLAAEAQTAKLLESIKAGESQSQLNQQYEQLQEQLAKAGVAPPSESPVQPSVGSQRPGGQKSGGQKAGQRAGGQRSGQRTGGAASNGLTNSVKEPSFFYAGRVRNAELRAVMNVLQARIQDAILLTARMDADEPVPAKYRELVDEYYQTLSDDLR